MDTKLPIIHSKLIINGIIAPVGNAINNSILNSNTRETEFHVNCTENAVGLLATGETF